jgi:hypothetical protein
MLKFIACAFLAIALSGCCLSGTSCYAPAAGSQAAWDGLNEPPQDETPKTSNRRKKDIAAAAQPKGDVEEIARPQTKEARPQTKEEWQQQEAADRADDARLTKKLKICSGCSTAPEKADDATDGYHR